MSRDRRRVAILRMDDSESHAALRAHQPRLRLPYNLRVSIMAFCGV